MGIARGLNIVRDGLVFGVDTGYGVADNATSTRFYPGESTDNKLRLFTSNTLSNPTNIYRVTVTEQNTVDSSAPNGQYSRYTGIDGSSNNQVFYSYAGSGFNYTGQTITYSVYLKGSGTCHLTTYDNQSGYGTSGTITLTNEWVRYSYTRTVNGSASNHWSGVRGILSSTDVYVAASQMEIKGHSTPFTPTTRSSTASLIDLKRTTDIDVGNVSFDSNAQPTFDGTDDFLTVPSYSGFTVDAKTVEIIFKMNGSYSNFSPLAVYANGSSSSNRIWLGLQNSKFQMHGWGTVDPSGTTTIAADTWYVCSFSYNKLTQEMKMYTNGVLESTTTNTQGGVTAVSGMNWYLATIPGGYQSVTYSDVDIPSFKIYNRILSDAEVAQNYKAYKNRFNI